MRNPQPWEETCPQERPQGATVCPCHAFVFKKQRVHLNLGKSPSIKVDDQPEPSCPAPHLSSPFPISTAQVSNTGWQDENVKGPHVQCATTEGWANPTGMLVLKLPSDGIRHPTLKWLLYNPKIYFTHAHGKWFTIFLQHLIFGKFWLFMLWSSPSCFNRVQLFVTPWTIAQQAPLSMEFSRQEYWSGLPFPLPGDLPDPGIEPMSLKSPALAGRFFTTTTPLGSWSSLASTEKSLKRANWNLRKKCKTQA